MNYIQVEELPTPLALIANRVNVAGNDGEMATFMTASYLFEAAIKTIAIVFQAGLRQKAPEQAYQMGYELLQTNGLGTWNDWIRKATAQPLVGLLPTSYSELRNWAIQVRKPEDEWFQIARNNIEYIFKELGLPIAISGRKPTVRDLISAFVELRNKTRGHGAVSLDFCHTINSRLIEAIQLLLNNCPLFRWKWIYLSTLSSDKLGGVTLHGLSLIYSNEIKKTNDIISPGIYIMLPLISQPLGINELIITNRECTEFLFPNGVCDGGKKSAFIDYASGREKQLEIVQFTRIPASLPPSETEGTKEFDVQGNIFGNLPPVPERLIPRHKLEKELDFRLRDQNHSIITLHGRGGIGKTSLALKVSHALANEPESTFEYMIWFSARDLDLRPSGPALVRPAVVSLENVSKFIGTLFGSDGSIDSFARLLHSPIDNSNRGILFIFDNFETMDDLRGLHEFLDLHTHLPNKVLITSRERSFKADFPIEVHGMEENEARELMVNVGQELCIEGLLTEDVIQKIFNYSEGHPYVIRVILGEMQKEGRYTPPSSLLPQRLNIVNAVCERSFNKLSDEGRRVFLTVACWKSPISELSLIVVLGQRNLDVERGIDECYRLSLIERWYFLDQQPAYTAPEIARLYGKKKLEGDPDRLLVEEDLAILQGFGVLSTAEMVQVPQNRVLNNFIDSCFNNSVGMGTQEQKRIDRVIETLAELWPDAWVRLGKYRMQTSASVEATEYAFRRAVEENPSNKEALSCRANFAYHHGDKATFISTRIRMAELNPNDMDLIRDIAFEVTSYVNTHIDELPLARRGIYLSSIRNLMVPFAVKLDATGLSRLAWLFLLEQNISEAWKFAAMGLIKEPNNNHCLNIIDRLRSNGYYGP